jgi:hypothetical protein
VIEGGVFGALKRWTYGRTSFCLIQKTHLYSWSLEFDVPYAFPTEYSY